MRPSVTSRQIDRALRLRPERAAIHAHHVHADELRAEDAEPVEDRREQRHRDDAAEEARRDDAAHRIHRHHLHRGELVRGAHQADLGRERGAGATREQQRGDHGAELLEQTQRRGDTQRGLRPEPGEQVVTLQAERHADEQAAQHDDDERTGTGVVDLVRDQTRPGQRGDAGAEDFQQEQRDPADAREHVEQRLQEPEDARAAHSSSPAAARPDRRAPDSGTAPGRRARPP